MSRKIGNAQSRATFFRHSAVMSLPAVLLRKLYLLKEYQSVQKPLSINLLTDIATNHYQHCQIMEKQFLDGRLLKRNKKGNETWVSPEVFYGVNLKRQKQSYSESKNA